MSDLDDTDVDHVDDDFEILGRQAGAELRRQPPVGGAGEIVRTARRRRATIAVTAIGVTVSILVSGLLVATSLSEDKPARVATVTTTSVVTTTPPPENVEAPDAPRTTTPGTWREVTSSSFAPDVAAAAVWTGSEAIVVGSNATSAQELFAVAHDLGQDRWRRLPDLPPALTWDSLLGVAPAMQWTGSDVLIATSHGEVYAYVPELDRWETRARADESMAFGAGVLVAVSARGVLVRSATGWWWYENSSDRWESVPTPSDADGYSMLGALDQNRIVATRVDGATITSAVFEIATRTWRTGPPVEDAPALRRADAQLWCTGNDGLLVCAGEDLGEFVGVVIDPLIGTLDTFRLGSHSNPFTVTGLPWITHAAKLLAPRTAMWEDLPPIPQGLDGFGAAVWTGSEIVFFGGGRNGLPYEYLGATVAYTPLRLPGQ